MSSEPQAATSADASAANAARKHWMGVLARAGLAELQAAWQAVGVDGPFENVRAPERGLVMARGRAGGSGQPFNLGEVSVTRCSVRGPGGLIGQAYCLGTDTAKAELAARFDALLQDSARQAGLMKRVISPLAADQDARRDARARKAAATKVDFFTMVRGS